MNRLDTLNPEILNLLIEHELLRPLILKELTKELIKNVEIEKEVLIQIKNSIMKREGLKDEEDFHSWLLKSNLNEEKFFDKITNPMKLNKYSLDTYGHMVNARFLKRKTDLDQFTYSLIRVNDRFLAQEIYFKILDDESKFGELASIYSDGQEKNTKGIVGPTSATQSHPQLREKLISSSLGVVNTPININNVWAIIRVESKQECSLNEDIELLMAKELFEEFMSKEVNQVFQNLLNKNSLIEA